jgi:hypothetical protein
VSRTCPPKNFHPLLTTIWHLALSSRVFPYVFAFHVCASCDSHSNHPQYLDPLSGTVKRHMFFGLMKIFRREYIIMCFLLTLKVCDFHGILRRWDRYASTRARQIFSALSQSIGCSHTSVKVARMPSLGPGFGFSFCSLPLLWDLRSSSGQSIMLE